MRLHLALLIVLSPALPFNRAFAAQAATSELASLLRSAFSPANPNAAAFRAVLPAEVARPMLAVDRLDARQPLQVGALDPLARLLPEDFESRLAAELDRSRPGSARVLAHELAAAHEAARREVAQAAETEVFALLNKVSRGEAGVAELESSAAELDALEIYGPKVWALAGHVRETLRAAHSRDVSRSMEATAKALLDRHSGEGPWLALRALPATSAAVEVPAEPAPSAAPAASAPQAPAAPKEATARLIAEIYAKAISPEFNVEEKADTVDVVDSKTNLRILRVNKEKRGNGYEVEVRRSYQIGVRKTLVEAGLTFTWKFQAKKRLPEALRKHFVQCKVGAVLGTPDPGVLAAADLKHWNTDLDVMRRRVLDKKMSPEAEAAALRELEHIADSDLNDSEYFKAKRFIMYLLALPWQARTEDKLDIDQARRMLDLRQYGLEKVKERVLEILAVAKRKGSLKGTILCLEGPPGVGKTSIASAIAEALGRKFARVSVGGLHDESDLRGHGRTYTGSRPGAFINRMMEAGTRNPVILIDEIDKIGKAGHLGDPEAVMLELLDPAQNGSFVDHYLDLGYDFSDVLFITTANYLKEISPALRDRMEIVHFPAYTPAEKLGIAERHLVPSKRAATGLKAGEVDITRAALERIIDAYAPEAGVRELGRKIEAVFRKVVARVERKLATLPVSIGPDRLEEHLGAPPRVDVPLAPNGVGTATGLYVAGSVGGIDNVEVSVHPGTGKIRLRRQMMKMLEDSAMGALTCVRNFASSLGLKDEDFTRRDIDIAFTPAQENDGPSAGTLMVTAIASAMTGRPVRAGIAMTGEVTPKGRVLPIGGLKEKIMAAHRAGCHTVLYPASNHSQLADLPREIREDMQLIPVSTIQEVFHHALTPPDSKPSK